MISNLFCSSPEICQKNLGDEWLYEIFSELEYESDLDKCSLVCKNWFLGVKNWQIQYEDFINKNHIFGKKQWQTLGVKIGDVPLLPKKIHQFVEKQCKIWPDKKFVETHMITLILEEVEGKPLDFIEFGKIMKKFFPNTEKGYRDFCEWFAKYIGNKTVGKSRFVAMTTDVLPESRRKLYHIQEKMVTDLAAETKNPYKIPEALIATICILTKYISSGKPVFASAQETPFIKQFKGRLMINKYPKYTSTRCIEKSRLDTVERNKIIVGDVNQVGIRVIYCCYETDEDVGIAVLMDLNNSTI